jgi:hypothetical protein
VLGVAVGSGLGVVVGSGVGVALALGIEVAVGFGVRVALGLADGVAVGFGIGDAMVSVSFGNGDAIGSSVGVGIDWSVNVSLGSVAIALGCAVGVDIGDSSITAGPLWRKGEEAASCARTNGEAVMNTVAIARKRVVFFRIISLGRISQSEASARALTRSSRIGFAATKCPIEILPKRSALRLAHGESAGWGCYAEKKCASNFDLRALHC